MKCERAKDSLNKVDVRSLTYQSLGVVWAVCGEPLCGCELMLQVPSFYLIGDVNLADSILFQETS